MNSTLGCVVPVAMFYNVVSIVKQLHRILVCETWLPSIQSELWIVIIFRWGPRNRAKALYPWPTRFFTIYIIQWKYHHVHDLHHHSYALHHITNNTYPLSHLTVLSHFSSSKELSVYSTWASIIEKYFIFAQRELSACSKIKRYVVQGKRITALALNSTKRLIAFTE